MPTYNRARIIARAIESVLAQRHEGWQLLIVDDGSTDETSEVVAPFLADNRIRYFSRPRVGVSAARNFGLSASQGEIITYLDTDNTWYRDYLHAVARAYASRPSLACAYAALEIEEGSGRTSVLWDAFDRAKLLKQNYIDMNVFSHRRTVFEQLGGFDERMTSVVDWDIILKYTEKHTPFELPIIGALYTKTESNRITLVEKFEPNFAILRAKWGI